MGSNTLVGTRPEKTLEEVRIMVNRENNWGNQFGNGRADERVVKILESAVSSHELGVSDNDQDR